MTKSAGFDELVARVQASQLPPPVDRAAIRQSAGLSLREIGDVLEVAPLTVLRWERGEACPRRENAVRYGRLLKMLHEAQVNAA